MSPSEPGGVKPRLVGINHVALEVGSIEEALAFYGRIFGFTLRGRGQRSAFIDMGDQFLALTETAQTGRDRHRHFGLVGDDRAAVKARAEAAGAEVMDTGSVDFRDPWGNRSEKALAQLRKKNMAPPGADAR
jgi:catechol 2,3-dioxygenase-like lactoylglutathione lyase family enzyme